MQVVAVDLSRRAVDLAKVWPELVDIFRVDGLASSGEQPHQRAGFVDRVSRRSF